MPSGPTGRREESVQFSLKELLKLEDERLAEQTRERQARDAAAARERDESERRKRAELEEKVRTETEARERQRHAELDDLARREAMQKAVVEQSRLEVEVRARAEERERERTALPGEAVAADGHAVADGEVALFLGDREEGVREFDGAFRL